MTWTNKAEQSTFELNLLKNRIPDLTNYFVIGSNTDVGTAFETIWPGGGFTKPTAERQHDIASTNANDTFLGGGGTGLQAVNIDGISGGRRIRSEVALLQGTTPTTTARSYSFINCLFGFNVFDDGTEHINEGTVTATALIDNTVSCEMAPNTGISHVGFLKVPDDKISNFHKIKIQAGRNISSTSTSIDVRFKSIRPEGSVHYSQEFLLHTQGTSTLEIDRIFPFDIKPGSIIVAEAKGEQTNNTVNVSWTMVLDQS